MLAGPKTIGETGVSKPSAPAKTPLSASPYARRVSCQELALLQHGQQNGCRYAANPGDPLFRPFGFLFQVRLVTLIHNAHHPRNPYVWTSATCGRTVQFSFRIGFPSLDRGRSATSMAGIPNLRFVLAQLIADLLASRSYAGQCLFNQLMVLRNSSGLTVFTATAQSLISAPTWHAVVYCGVWRTT